MSNSQLLAETAENNFPVLKWENSGTGMRQIFAKLLRTGTAPVFTLLLTAVPAHAGVILDFAPNGVVLSARVDVGFKGTGLVAADFEKDTDFQVAPDTVLLTSALAVKSKLPPGGGGAKDIAKGELEIAFEHGLSFPGASSPVDLIHINIAGDASAVTAMNTAGNSANAQVSGTASAEFFLDPGFGGVAAGDFVGSLEIGAIRSLMTFESVLQVLVSEDGSNIASLPAGSSATTVQLFAGHAYMIAFDYNIEVPFGNDPPFSFTLDIPILSVTEAPEPATLALLGLGLAGIGFSRRKSAN